MNGARKIVVAIRRQEGQALPIGMALMLFGVLLGIVLFNTGQIASEKQRVANTADAAVYSGLIWQARALNFQAYTNRAMVANQVTIAQAVSVASWGVYARGTTVNLDSLLGWIPIVGQITAAVRQVADIVATILLTIAKFVVPVLDTINNVLSEAQQVVYLASFAATPSIVEKVTETNDSRYTVDSTYAIAGLARNARDWQQFAKRYTVDDPEMDRKKNVVNNSLDRFSSDRNWKFGFGFDRWAWLSPVHKLMVIREGTTKLVEVPPKANDPDNPSAGSSKRRYEWKGKDTMSLHVKRLSWRGWKSSEVPIGWGGAHVPKDIECEGKQMYGKSFSGFSGGDEGKCSKWFANNHTAEKLLNNNISIFDSQDVMEQVTTNYNGLRAYYDLKDLSRDNKDPRVLLKIEVAVADSNVRTSSKVSAIGSPHGATQPLRNGIGKGMFSANDKMAAGAIASIAGGEVFFKRPEGGNAQPKGLFGRTLNHGQNYTEYANLFNPYWDVRLNDISDKERMAAWLLRAPGIASAAPGAVRDGLALYREDTGQDLERAGQTRAQLEAQLRQTSDADERQRIQTELDALESRLQTVQTNLANTQGNLSNSAYTAGPLSANVVQGASGLAATLQSGASDADALNALKGQYQDQIDQFKDQIADQLKQALINGVKGSISSAAPELVQQARDVQQQAQQLEAALNNNVQMAQERLDSIQAEYEAASQQVQREFEPVEQALRAELEQTLAPLQTELEQYAANAANDLLPQAQRDAAQAEVVRLEELIHTETSAAEDAIHQELVTRTEQATGALSQELVQAQQEVLRQTSQLVFEDDAPATQAN